MTAASEPRRQPAARTSPACHLRRALAREANPLCRPVDRARSRLLLGMWLALALSLVIATVVSLALLNGMRTAAGQIALHRHLVTATTLAAAPAKPVQADGRGPVRAAWTYPPVGRTSDVIEVPIGTAAGTAVPLWVDDGGVPAPPPRADIEMTVSAGIYGLGVLSGLGSAAWVGYAVRCRALDRRAERTWEPAWELVEPLWSGRGHRWPDNGES
ncbi:hypothetical protein [Kitasatospora sp. GP82]|uniref:Rv1733c family protein n=1 Tax=Kitasatospora sp. GP82 TaxID=3035089 RepID=UPI00247338F3|nr:hypothetical protein [Kitasatospora sp. GP82]MDH6124038.1 hypothetical protein [Kitasatospora sp. GP82]